MLALGINTLMAADDGAGGTVGGSSPPGGSLLSAANEGMFIVPQFPLDPWSAWSYADAQACGEMCVGYLAWDEPELAGSMTYAQWEADVATTRGDDSERFLHTNFGPGINRSHWWAADTPDEVVQAVGVVDSVGCDAYYYTNPSVIANSVSASWPNGAATYWPGPGGDYAYGERAGAYGWQARELRRMQQEAGGYMPTWITLETKLPFLNATNIVEHPSGTYEPDIILYEEIEGAVWSGITNEARGLMYFQQNGLYSELRGAGVDLDIDPNTGVAPNEALFSLEGGEQALKDTVAAINADIATLAPVINTQSYVYDFSAGVETMLKAYGGDAYIFASVGLGQTTGSKTFTLPAGISGTTVEKLHGGGTTSVSGGTFAHTFPAEYSHEVFRIAI
jgi:hypothetical protein